MSALEQKMMDLYKYSFDMHTRMFTALWKSWLDKGTISIETHEYNLNLFVNQLSQEEIEEYLSEGVALTKRIWNAHRPTSELEFMQFYKENLCYIFELYGSEQASGKLEQMEKMMICLKDSALPKDAKILIHGTGVGTDVLPILLDGYTNIHVLDSEGMCNEWFMHRVTSCYPHLASNITNITLPPEYELDDIFEEESFDMIITFDTLEHVHNPLLELRRLYRALRTGGFFQIQAMFNKDSGRLEEKLDTHPLHVEKDPITGVQLRGAHFKSVLLNELRLTLFDGYGYTDYIKFFVK